MHGEDLDEIVNCRDVNEYLYDNINDFKFFNDTAINYKNNFTLLNLNIRSYNRNFDELLFVLNDYERKFDVIVLTETWMDDSCVPVCVDGYDVIVSKTCKNQNDGVIVYVSKSFAVCHQEVSLHGATK